MINNIGARGVAGTLFLALSGLACDVSALFARDEAPEAWQGVIEFEDRIMAFQVAGQVSSVLVDAGDGVALGATLARLDDTLERLSRDTKAADARAALADLELKEAGSRPEDIRSTQASLAAAKASEHWAERSLAREQALADDGVAVVATLDQARNAYDVAVARRRELEASLARLRHGSRVQEIASAAARAEASQSAVLLGDARIERHVLVADAPAVVLDRHIEPGEVVQAGTPVVTLGDPTHPYVDVFVPQAEAGTLVLGDPVHVRVDARDHAYPGVVEHVGQRTEFTPKFLFSPRERPNLVIRVRVRIDAPRGDLPAGVPAFVHPGKVSGAGEVAG